MSRREGKALALDVQIEFSRDSDNMFRLLLADDASRLQIIEVAIDAEQFADMMSSRMTTRRSKAKLYQSDKHGKHHENHTVMLYREPNDYGDMAALQAEAEQWMKDNPGWEIDSYDLENWNTHNAQRDGYAVTARRWVDKKEESGT